MSEQAWTAEQQAAAVARLATAQAALYDTSSDTYWWRLTTGDMETIAEDLEESLAAALAEIARLTEALRFKSQDYDLTMSVIPVLNSKIDGLRRLLAAARKERRRLRVENERLTERLKAAQAVVEAAQAWAFEYPSSDIGMYVGEERALLAAVEAYNVARR